MRFGCTITVLLLLLPAIAAASHELVLVTGESCPADDISMLDMRKAYLGIGVELDGIQVQALRLADDEHMDEIFFQNVVAMSRKSYERRLLSLTLKHGTPRPPVFRSAEEIAAELRRRTCSIGYLWLNDAERLAGIKIIRLLWRRD